MDKKQYDGRIAGYLDDFLAVAISAAAPAPSATGTVVSSLSHPWSKVVKKQRPFRFPHKNKFFKFLYFLSVFFLLANIFTSTHAFKLQSKTMLNPIF